MIGCLVSIHAGCEDYINKCEVGVVTRASSVTCSICRCKSVSVRLTTGENYILTLCEVTLKGLGEWL